MKVFQDVFTNDELMSDVFHFDMEFNDVIMKVKSAFKSKENVGNINIGCGNAFGGDEEEAGEDGPAEKVNDVVYNFNLTETQLSKSDFMTFIKGFLKNLKAFLEAAGQTERAAAFQKGAQDFIKTVVPKFDDYTFYLGAKESMDGSIVLSFWEDETAAGPVFYFFKDALKEIKV